MSHFSAQNIPGASHPKWSKSEVFSAPCDGILRHPPNLFSPAPALSLSCAQLFVTPWTVACQPPKSVGFSRQEYWSGLPFPSPGDLPNPGTFASALACRFFNNEPPRKPLLSCYFPPLSLHSSCLGLLTEPRPHWSALSSGPFSVLFLLSPQTPSFFSPPSLPSCPYSRVGLLREAFIDHPIKNCKHHPPNSYSPFQLLFCLSAFHICLYLVYLFIMSCTLECKLHGDGEFFFFFWSILFTVLSSA